MPEPFRLSGDHELIGRSFSAPFNRRTEVPLNGLFQALALRLRGVEHAEQFIDEYLPRHVWSAPYPALLQSSFRHA